MKISNDLKTAIEGVTFYLNLKMDIFLSNIKPIKEVEFNRVCYKYYPPEEEKCRNYIFECLCKGNGISAIKDKDGTIYVILLGKYKIPVNIHMSISPYNKEKIEYGFWINENVVEIMN